MANLEEQLGQRWLSSVLLYVRQLTRCSLISTETGRAVRVQLLTLTRLLLILLHNIVYTVMSFQLVDFEAMTTPSPDSFSKTAKSWMNLKRYKHLHIEFVG